MLKIWKYYNPVLAKEYYCMKERPLMNQDSLEALANLPIPTHISGREASNIVVNVLVNYISSLYGGSADLARSDGTFLHKYPFMNRNDLTSRNIKYGVREFAMASIAAGLSLSNFFTPFIGTFLAFSDYMRNAIRITAMMKLRVIYQFTHDSFIIGEDGPTHQPIEHIASLRAIPNLRVIRPADFCEVQYAWISALNYSGPTALILSRQTMQTLPITSRDYMTTLARGAYIVLKEKLPCPDIIILATGSEVELALNVAHKLDELSVRVISMPCCEIFDQQNDHYKNEILCPKKNILKVSIEAGISQGWHRYIGTEGLSISIDHFGETGAPDALRLKFAFKDENIIEKIKQKLKQMTIQHDISKTT